MLFIFSFPPVDLNLFRVSLLQGGQGRRRVQLGSVHGGFGKGVGEILWKAANVLQNKLTRAQHPDEVT